MKKYVRVILFIFLLTLFFFSYTNFSNAQSSYSITRAVISTLDDAHQLLSGGSANRGSGTLSLGQDSSGNALTVGVRFTHLTIPAGATITDTRIQFTAWGAWTGASNITIQAHDIGNSKNFTDPNSSSSILNPRPKTTALITWSPPDWNTSGEAGADQLTPNLAPILQAIVNRPDWEAGNNVSFLITGTGTRGIRSFDRKARDGLDGEPVLTITYQTTNQPPSVALTSPATDQVITEGPFTMTADAADPDGSIDRVEFLIDETVIGSDTSAPYSVDVSGTEVYKHKAVARAYDNQGLTARSTEVEFKIRPPVPAFPGAEGFGAYSKGGRGGRVIEVTNLSDSGPGSLRACVEASGSRTCVFRVAGYIDTSGMTVEDRGKDFITIAGQTAPGDGITLRGTKLFGIRKAHDAIVRYIRLRGTAALANRDCFNSGKNSWNNILDHISCSWSTDEGLSSGGEGTHLGDLTIQRSIAAEGIKGHSMGGLISDNFGATLHHNLFINNNARNPKMIGHTSNSGSLPNYFDFVNNVVYNWGSYASHCAGTANCNLVGNYYLPGPNYDTRRPELLHDEERAPIRIYMQGNVGPSCPNGCEVIPECDPNDPNNISTQNPDPLRPAVNVGTHDTMCMAGKWRGEQYCLWWGDQTICDWGYSDTRIPMPQTNTTSAQDALNGVLSDVGANKGLNADGTFFDRSDAVDIRLINAVSDCLGKPSRNDCAGFVPTTPADVGGFPTLDPGTAYADDDHDGMADVWEVNNFGDTSRGDANDSSSDFDADGYTDLEEFLNGTNPLVAEAGSSQPTSTPLPTPTPTPTPLPGDANGDGAVDGVDYVIWLNNYNQASSDGPVDGDFNGDQIIDGVDYVIWLTNYTG